MSKEAMKLALEALEGMYIQGFTQDDSPINNAITALREALAEQPAQQDSTCSNALRAQGKAYPRTCKKCGLGPCVELAQQALNKKAESAREQPAQKCSYPYCGCNSKAWCKVERNEALDKMAENARELGLDYEPAQQEPFTYYRHYDGGLQDWPDEKTIPLYTSPPAQRTWVDLTPQNLNEIFKVANTGEGAVHLALKLIKEKNT